MGIESYKPSTNTESAVQEAKAENSVEVSKIDVSEVANLSAQPRTTMEEVHGAANRVANAIRQERDAYNLIGADVAAGFLGRGRIMQERGKPVTPERLLATDIIVSGYIDRLKEIKNQGGADLDVSNPVYEGQDPETVRNSIVAGLEETLVDLSDGYRGISSETLQRIADADVGLASERARKTIEARQKLGIN